MEYDILKSVLGSPFFRKLPYRHGDNFFKCSAGVLGLRIRVWGLALCEFFLHASLGGKELSRKRLWSQGPWQANRNMPVTTCYGLLDPKIPY